MVMGATALVLLLALSALSCAERSHAQTTGSRGSPAGAPATPTLIDLRSVLPGGSSPRSDTPRRHPGGDAELNRAKAVAVPTLGHAHESLNAPLTLNAAIGFDGIDDAQSTCACSPPDGAIAVGPSRIVAAVNAAFSIWDRSGNPLAGYPKSLSSLLTNANCLAGIADPFAEYDRGADRFMVGALTFDASNNSSVCIGVSQTSDPTTT
jgi:hypothetical protein